MCSIVRACVHVCVNTICVCTIGEMKVSKTYRQNYGQPDLDDSLIKIMYSVRKL